jgi:hypothetical protein
VFVSIPITSSCVVNNGRERIDVAILELSFPYEGKLFWNQHVDSKDFFLNACASGQREKLAPAACSSSFHMKIVFIIPHSLGLIVKYAWPCYVQMNST